MHLFIRVSLQFHNYSFNRDFFKQISHADIPVCAHARARACMYARLLLFYTNVAHRVARKIHLKHRHSPFQPLPASALVRDARSIKLVDVI